ncbi:MAG: SPOR domain-containing protein [Halioglobus sp.]|nr:SPOR domain-containing protein [Halioglobus sp.]
MARDFAKRRQGAGGRNRPARTRGGNASRRRPATRATGGWRWYVAGLLSGIFLSFLVYLGTLSAPGDTAHEAPPQAHEAVPPPRPRFDFYTMLPQQSIEVETDSAAAAAPQPSAAPAAELYLQAGSFRQRDDADRRRAELLLLGLEPRIKEASGDNGRWYRVYLGPFDSRAAMSRARSLTAGQGIDTLLLQRDNR